ncbi:DUF2516 family protein [Corynebacterium sp. 153RC1]|uniref:DUF2516 family protein n=1 Tax=Corynebacterium TaxID=1716 RepID=UPI00211C3B1E|nr:MULTISPECIES: DUF2516 family protein [unclassified Corynebacterium]MCQ9370591.1 DUF2516 family protein [Corynebacterium sp. 35RC1]MCQ9342693.1 DUF2516 family protein [Corynebacterium sp. 76QC2CO]MCQ9351754.1 DUF2516 family protein [Corynebacterium sp. 209RC1]MCQ9354490.1 DUF2516 family protein [Corynebacterium sp. 1222RC1]MCQ9356036.1 DUF2516 family protein [Corynebacterium sp. 122RC1]
MNTLQALLPWLAQIPFLLIALAGVVGAAQVLFTRDDAFTAADRLSKWAWAGILIGSAFAAAMNLMFLSWVGIVMIGLYWFDVRPQIRNILNGNYGW